MLNCKQIFLQLQDIAFDLPNKLSLQLSLPLQHLVSPPSVPVALQIGEFGSAQPLTMIQWWPERSERLEE